MSGSSKPTNWGVRLAQWSTLAPSAFNKPFMSDGISDVIFFIFLYMDILSCPLLSNIMSSLGITVLFRLLWLMKFPFEISCSGHYFFLTVSFQYVIFLNVPRAILLYIAYHLLSCLPHMCHFHLI